MLNLPTGEALLFGVLPDHAALYGVLTRMRDLTIKIITVGVTPCEERPAFAPSLPGMASG